MHIVHSKVYSSYTWVSWQLTHRVKRVIVSVFHFFPLRNFHVLGFCLSGRHLLTCQPGHNVKHKLGSNILMHIVRCTVYSTPIVMANGALCQIYDCVKQTKVQFIYWALIFTGQRRRLVCKTTTSFQCIKENMFGKIQN